MLTLQKNYGRFEPTISNQSVASVWKWFEDYQVERGLSMDNINSIYKVMIRKSTGFFCWLDTARFRVSWAHHFDLEFSGMMNHPNSVAILSYDSAMLLKEMLWDVLNEHYNNKGK